MPETQQHPAKVEPVEIPLPDVGKGFTAIVEPRVRQEFQAVEAIADLDQLKPGPRRLFELLHAIGLQVAKARNHHPSTSQVLIFTAQELLAAALGVHRVTVWRWAGELKQAGLIAAKHHYTTATVDSQPMTRIDGMLYAVRMRPGYRPLLRTADLKHQYRNLTKAVEKKNTVYNACNNHTLHEENDWFKLLVTYAVNPDSDISTPLSSDCCTPKSSVSDVAYTLLSLATVHPTKRAESVGRLASALANALGDNHSRRYWCKVIWDAWENAALDGLQALAAQLLRLQTDIREWDGLRNPAALFASRVRQFST